MIRKCSPPPRQHEQSLHKLRSVLNCATGQHTRDSSSGRSIRMRSYLAPASAATLALTFGSTSSIFCTAEHCIPKNRIAFVPNSRYRLVKNSYSTSTWSSRMMSSTPSNADVAINRMEQGDDENWKDVLPFRDGSHNSAKIAVPAGSRSLHGSPFHRSSFQDRLKATVNAARELGKSSIWVDVPLSRGSLLEDMSDLGFAFHHAQGDVASLNLWLKDTESKVPEFATHHVGVGAVVVNTKNEILCVRELRKNYMPWKIPGGLSDLGEKIPEAAIREVLEETGIPTRFHSILSFRQTHGLANGRSDLFFVCKLDPIEENGIIPKPIPQESEIEAAEWIPMSEYKDLIYGRDGGPGHPMMRHVMDVYEEGFLIKERTVLSVVPGRAPNSMYQPCLESNTYLN